MAPAVEPPKRGAGDGAGDGSADGRGGKAPRSKRSAASQLSRASIRDEPDTELVFEDPYGDDYETDDEAEAAAAAAAAAAKEDGHGETGASEARASGPRPMVAGDKVVFRPGIDKLGPGETLVCDESAYDVLERLTLDWPALSFDFICAADAGTYCNVGALPPSTYPMSVMAVAGTQASGRADNKLQVWRMSNIRRIRTRSGGAGGGEDSEKDDDDDDDDGSDDTDDDDDDDDVRDAVLEHRSVKFDTVANRVRVMPQRANVVAVWGENGRVSLIDLATVLGALDRDAAKRMPAVGKPSAAATKPFMSFNGHGGTGVEGYGLAWSRVVPGRLASGACNGSICVWDMSGGADGDGRWTVSPDKLRGHKGSVEDIQWSPNEQNVLASCGVDRTIRFWDAREHRRSVLWIPDAHADDVNVISWNANETHLLASGGDDCQLRVWDMRTLTNGGGGAGASKKNAVTDARPAAEFAHHEQPITAVEWHPRDASMMAVSSEDGSVSVWDLAVERDAEEELREGIVLGGAEEYPPQLLFVHMGQRNTKELHWHPTCASLIGTTAEDGMNLFKPANITLPE